MDALVMAGGTWGEPGTEQGVSPKAMLDINGRPMLDYVLDALKGSTHVERIFLLLPSSIPAEPWAAKVDAIDRADGGLAENFYAGLDLVSADKRFLVVSADIPLLTPQAVDDFVSQCEETNASVCYPMTPKAAIERKYPTTQRTYITLAEGKFTGGNMFVADPRVALAQKDLMKRASEARKSPIKFLRILGLGFVFKFIFRLLTIRDLEEKISSLIGARGVCIKTSRAEISTDVDKPSDLELVRAELKRRKSS